MRVVVVGKPLKPYAQIGLQFNLTGLAPHDLLPRGSIAGTSVRKVSNRYRRAPISEPERRLLDFAVLLTQNPSSCTESEIHSLRQAGWSDRAILDCTLIISYFAFVNRIADGLGVQLEAGMKEGL